MMKKTRMILLLAILINGLCQSKTYRIGLINPTPKNIEKVIFLKEQKLIDIDSLEIIGIYHSSQEEDIESSIKLIADSQLNNVSILTIKNSIPLDSLFSLNKCTKEFQDIFHNTDGLIFPGGADIPPSVYGEKALAETKEISEGRYWETSFLFHLLGGSQNPQYTPLLEEKPNYLILGICLGMQEINVASGGSLYQDIPSQIYKKKTYTSIIQQDIQKQHKNYQRWVNNKIKNKLHFHHIQITTGSSLDYGLTENPLVTSVHHQAVKELGKNLQIIATSQDGKVVEAISNTKYKNVYGVQFHPEFSKLYKEGELKNAKNETVNLNSTDKDFLRKFWKDFSLKLSESSNFNDKQNNKELLEFIDSIAALPIEPLMAMSSYIPDSIFYAYKQLNTEISRKDFKHLKQGIKDKVLPYSTAKNIFGKIDSSIIKNDSITIKYFSFGKKKFDKYAICLGKDFSNENEVYFFTDKKLIAKQSIYHRYELEIEDFTDADKKTVVYYKQNFTSGSGIWWYNYFFYKYDGDKFITVLNELQNANLQFPWGSKSLWFESKVQSTNPLTMQLIYNSSLGNEEKIQDIVNDTTVVKYIWDKESRILVGDYNQSKITKPQILSFYLTNNDLLFIHTYADILKAKLQNKESKEVIANYLNQVKKQLKSQD